MNSYQSVQIQYRLFNSAVTDEICFWQRHSLEYCSGSGCRGFTIAADSKSWERRRVQNTVLSTLFFANPVRLIEVWKIINHISFLKLRLWSGSVQPEKNLRAGGSDQHGSYLTWGITICDVQADDQSDPTSVQHVSKARLHSPRSSSHNKTYESERNPESFRGFLRGFVWGTQSARAYWELECLWQPRWPHGMSSPLATSSSLPWLFRQSEWAA